MHVSIVSYAWHLIGLQSWDLLWKVARKDAEDLGCRRTLGSRGEPCFDNVLEEQGWSYSRTKALSLSRVAMWLRSILMMGIVIICLCKLPCFLLRKPPMRALFMCWSIVCSSELSVSGRWMVQEVMLAARSLEAASCGQGWETLANSGTGV